MLPDGAWMAVLLFAELLGFGLVLIPLILPGVWTSCVTSCGFGVRARLLGGV